MANRKAAPKPRKRKPATSPVMKPVEVEVRMDPSIAAIRRVVLEEVGRIMDRPTPVQDAQPERAQRERPVSTSTLGTPPSSTALCDLADRSRLVLGRLLGQIETLEAIGNRAFGEVPRPAEEKRDTIGKDGQAGAVWNAQAETFAALDRLESAVTRLCSIA